MKLKNSLEIPTQGINLRCTRTIRVQNRTHSNHSISALPEIPENSHLPLTQQNEDDLPEPPLRNLISDTIRKNRQFLTCIINITTAHPRSPFAQHLLSRGGG